jgi:hypothetical protein
MNTLPYAKKDSKKYDLCLNDAHGIGGGEVQLWMECSLTGEEFYKRIKVKVFVDRDGKKILRVIE